MSPTPHLKSLHQAVVFEKTALEACRQKNHDLFGKLMDYQEGRGPEPTVEEFFEWRESMKQIQFEKKLDTGFMDI